MKGKLRAIMIAASLVIAASAGAAERAAQRDVERCYLGLMKAKGKYERCVAEQIGAHYADRRRFFLTNLAKCRVKYDAVWSKLSDLTGTICDQPSRFVDNGDETITDHLTGLTWEKKDSAGGVHDLHKGASWSLGDPYRGDGVLFAEYLAVAPTSLNEGRFAGANDWRVPTIAELQTILRPMEKSCHPPPCVTEVFDTMCVSGCSAASCSCTNGNAYWSSTTYAPDASFAWAVDFDGGWVTIYEKWSPLNFRAVRGGW